MKKHNTAFKYVRMCSMLTLHKGPSGAHLKCYVVAMKKSHYGKMDICLGYRIALNCTQSFEHMSL